MGVLKKSDIEAFNEQLWGFYAQHKRSLPWREPEPDGHYDPYKILVSEIMLQQTQVDRVTPYFKRFIDAFPSPKALAEANLQDVYTLWQGLGYNRRSRFLLETARIIVAQFGGHVPKTLDELVSLPGIGKNTAGAILVYAYNQPAIFIETNIRTVLLHHFLTEEAELVIDHQLEALLALTLDKNNPRDYYCALMDYGSHLKKQGVKLNPRSKHYIKQSTFEGSVRQLRGKLLATISSQPTSEQKLARHFQDKRLKAVLTSLMKEEMICLRGDKYFIA